MSQLEVLLRLGYGMFVGFMAIMTSKGKIVPIEHPGSEPSTFMLGLRKISRRCLTALLLAAAATAFGPQSFVDPGGWVHWLNQVALAAFLVYAVFWVAIDYRARTRSRRTGEG